jgi:hypothetical protein
VEDAQQAACRQLQRTSEAEAAVAAVTGDNRIKEARAWHKPHCHPFLVI